MKKKVKYLIPRHVVSLLPKEAADFLGISISTLKMWELKGMVKPYRTDNRYRHYWVKELVQLKKKRGYERHRGMGN